MAHFWAIVAAFVTFLWCMGILGSVCCEVTCCISCCPRRNPDGGEEDQPRYDDNGNMVPDNMAAGVARMARAVADGTRRFADMLPAQVP